MGASRSPSRLTDVLATCFFFLSYVYSVPFSFFVLIFGVFYRSRDECEFHKFSCLTLESATRPLRTTFTWVTCDRNIGMPRLHDGDGLACGVLVVCNAYTLKARWGLAFRVLNELFDDCFMRQNGKFHS